ncbi:MAG: hypothetical protein MRZ79_21505 [Bacteroidia bacterium]|nr:hypothetical protein [Bacteroidia bacterium]
MLRITALILLSACLMGSAPVHMPQASTLPEKVEFGKNDPQNQSYDIYYHVPFIPQPTGAACWATSIAMILWWRDNEDAQMCLQDALTPAQVAGNLSYWNQYFTNGLSSYDGRALPALGFERIAPQSFEVSTLAEWLNTYGPMWVAYFGCTNPVSNCGHAVVLVGLKGDGTPGGTKVILHDPDDGTGTYPNLGVRDREMTYTEFIQRLDNRALDRLDRPAAQNNQVTFLAHLRRSN